MTVIKASLVKALRERTGAGMMECKKALVEVDGDIEAAIELMRKRGQAKAAKRAGQTAREGKVFIAVSPDSKQAYMVEVNCETDFVARDENFCLFVERLAQRGLESKAETVEKLLNLPDVATAGEQTLEAQRTALIAKVGENIQLRRVARLTSAGLIGTYCHGSRIGVMVSLDQPVPDIAKEIAMHVAAMNPQAVDADRVSPQLIEKEREIYLAQAKESGKPEAIVEKMVAGRIAKFIKEICLVEQIFVKDPDKTIKSLLHPHGAHVLDFVRFEVGEGVEKEIVDFAKEVQAQIKGQQ